MFVDTTIMGLTNLTWFAPRIWTVGHPTEWLDWNGLSLIVDPSNTKQVLSVQLHDDVEGDNEPFTKQLGWRLFKRPIPPQDDKPLSVFEMPKLEDVNDIIKEITEEWSKGYVIVFGCKHGRDRTGLIRALLGMYMFKWTKEYAWNQMLMHGFRWELPDLDLFFEKNA